MIIAADILTALGGLGIVFIGLRYVLAPYASAATFGLPDWPREAFRSWLNLKGVRDIGIGLLTLTMLVVASPTTLAWFVLVTALIPAGDMLVVLRYRGSKPLAYGMHGGTAAALVVTSALLLLG
ncbi:DUF4267 domain-containing protein [Actinophytocola sp.]|uniref:DUF4267 domain-containing protein n=1 Tax=Actinophytocola sp. TaxID=1872138 RepID=UPI0025BDCA03|nr:DUF4267 domain-containing protein [Actinophytocola sp.]